MTSAIVEMPASEAMDYSNATAAAAALTSLLSAAAEKQWWFYNAVSTLRKVSRVETKINECAVGVWRQI